MSRLTKNRQRGFTLVELLVSLAIAGLLVAGALQIHIAFNSQSRRQQAIADLQQTLRVALLIVERQVRSAGAGMMGGMLQAQYGGAGTTNYYGIQFSNSTTYTDPKTTFDSSTNNNDTDPDWLRVIAIDGVNSYAARLPAGGTGHALEVNSLTGWQVGDVLQVANPSGTSLPACARAVTALVPGTPPQLTLAGGDTRGFNPTSPDDPCVKASKFPAAIRRFPMSNTVFKIDGTTNPPRLVMRSAPVGTADATTTWTTIAEGIEDMQIAVTLIDGRVCGELGNSLDVDDPALCDFSQAAAVRITLVARSVSTLSGIPPQMTGGYEDRPGALATDGYVRRAMTAQIQLRNVVQP